jgi:MoxR-like ATPase
MNEKIVLVKKEISKYIVGQDAMVERIILSILLDSHILIEGLPGLAKSFAVDTISRVMGISFKRIQFTPDILPSDILGTQIYFQKTGEFLTKKGPIFANIILADEINRAPPKVQSALLEAMQEKQITIGDTTYSLEEPFVVLATQNPVEQDGTYPLPEAQQDRFIMKLSVSYPSFSEELEILNRSSNKNLDVKSILNRAEISNIKRDIESIHVEEKIKEYIVSIVSATRSLNKYILCGASPRASISMFKASKGIAFMNNRTYVTPDDVRSIAKDVLRHRVILNYQADIDSIDISRVIDSILDSVRMP